MVFQAATAFAGLAFLLVFLEKEVPLRTKLETEYGLKESNAKESKKTVKPDSEKAHGGEVKVVTSESSA